MVIGGAALAFSLSRGYPLYYGDAQAHLNIARRIIDSRTPGYEQIGTVWLPLPHVLALPLVSNDDWWRTGLAGAIPAMISYVVAGCFWFAAARRIFAGEAAAWTAMLIYALNPNVLYLATTPMTELIFFAGLAALFWGLVAYGQDQGRAAFVTAVLGSAATTMTRYEGWFLIPFACLALWIGTGRLAPAIRFGAFASIAPCYWLAHNFYYYSDALEFYRGQYSAKEMNKDYPGLHDFPVAMKFYLTAAQMNAGWPAVLIGIAGAAVAMIRRPERWIAFLAIPVVFYIWSLYQSGTPIFVPQLWHGSYYNTRYGLSALPLLAFAAGALAKRTSIAVALVALSVAPWIADPRPEAWITWKESEVNSVERRAWTREAAVYLKENYRPGAGIFTSFGDLAGIYGLAGIPLRETLHEGNGPAWLAAATLPDVFLHENWIVCLEGDQACEAAARSKRHYLARSIAKVRIYRN